MWSSLALALRLLTILPANSSTGEASADARRAVALFPLVGALVGSVAGLTFFIASRIWPDAASLVPPALTLIAGLVVTGARGIVGAARSADGLASLLEGDRSRALAIVRDPHRGAAGMVTASAGILLRFALLCAIPREHMWQGLLVAAACGQWASAVCFTAYPLVSGGLHVEEGRGLSGTGMNEFLLATGVAILCAAVWPVRGLLALVAAAVLVVPLAQVTTRAFGGGSSPLAFGLGELGEIAALLFFTIP